MGRIKQGANGGFSGKAGSVIGSNWKNVEYIKGRPKPSHKPASQRQLEQREKFARAVRFLKPIKDLLNFTCGSIKTERATGFNMAVKMVLAKAMLGDYPDYSIDYAAVVLSYGSLAEAEGSASSEAGGILKVSWMTQLNDFNGFADDKVTVLIYDPETNIYIHGPNNITRVDGEMEIMLGEGMIGQTLEIYLFFTARDGKKVSNSTYAGEVVVL